MLAEHGFHVFPLRPGEKLPRDPGYPQTATSDLATLRRQWLCPVLEVVQSFNIGISTTAYGPDNEPLLAIDVDCKNGKQGFASLAALEEKYGKFPRTFNQLTPTGSLHLIYRTGGAVLRQIVSTADKPGPLGPGIDTRSRGGYVVGAGSVVAAGEYTCEWLPVADAPFWLFEVLGRAFERELPPPSSVAESINRAAATERARMYLVNDAPIAVKGNGGDATTLQVALHLKDEGIVDPEECYQLMLELWNPRCPPGWAPEKLRLKVRNAYRYGRSPVGIAAPEVMFGAPAPDSPPASPPEPADPVSLLNKEYAVCVVGGKAQVIWETTDEEGRFRLENMSPADMATYLRPFTIEVGGKLEPVAKHWLSHPRRRTCRGMCFLPGQDAPPGYYNLWKGFAVEPWARNAEPSPAARLALDRFLEHTFENYCEGDTAIHRYLIAYFAQMMQRPQIKPRTCLVFRGAKRVGKSIVVRTIARLLGRHAVVAANSRYLLGNFNSHMEHLLFFILEEAFWSGDKAAESVLKDLITGGDQLVERKGVDAYVRNNYMRFAILGNERWVVPATFDEHRFAVFDVGAKRAGDSKYFGEMADGMAAGGYQLLLRYLLDFDLTGIDVNQAPNTKALLEQKLQSMDPFHEWWLACLTEGRILQADFVDGWPEQIERERLRDAYYRYHARRRISSRAASEREIGRMLRKASPSIGTSRLSAGDRPWMYRLPELDHARMEWEFHVGHAVDWEAEA